MGIRDSSAPAWMPGDDDAAGHRRYRHRRDRGVDAGDVLAGILIIGGIAAIANAAKGSSERYPTRDSRYPEPRRGGVSYDDGRGCDRAGDRRSLRHLSEHTGPD